jgi:predicted Zn-dependent peptidase
MALHYTRKYRFSPLFLTALIVCSLGTFSHAEDFSFLKSQVKKITLDNGLRIIVVSRDIAPVFSAQVWVKVGGADELPGASGAAHLLEHMAFKGTKNIGTSDYRKEVRLIDEYDSRYEKQREEPDEENSAKLKSIEDKLEEIWDIGAFTSMYQERGANGLNAGTSKDYTVYTVSLPSSELEFWFSIESERLINPVFRQYYKELQVVHEERRMRTDDNPSGKLYEALLATAYWDHPYGVPTIGWKHDLNNLLKKDAEYLHATYYRPDNIVITLVGNIDDDEVEKLAEKYFARFKKPGSDIPDRRVFPEVQNGERTTDVLFSAEPEFMIAYHIPTSPSPEALHFTLISTMLDDGRSSVFQKILVRDEQKLAGVSTGEAPGHRYDPVFLISGTPRSDVPMDDAVNRIQEILEDFGDTYLTQDLLDAARKRLVVGLLKRLQTNSGLARTLGVNELLFGGWEVLFEELETLKTITLEDIKHTSKKYFTVKNRTVAKIISQQE